MIKDLPSPSEYQDAAIECLIQAYNNIVNVDNSLNDETPRVEIWDYNQIVEYQDAAIECLTQAYNNIVNVDNSLNDETPRVEIWDYNQIVLRTALVLIHQGVEGLMKSEICRKSPFLLIVEKTVKLTTSRRFKLTT